MQQYAKRRGVTACTLHYVRRRLSTAGGTSNAPGAPGHGLVAVKSLGGSRASDESVSYELRLANGLCVRVPANFEAARVAELFSVERTC